MGAFDDIPKAGASNFADLPRVGEIPLDQQPVPAPAKSLGKGFWETFTEGGVDAFLRESTPGQIKQRNKDILEAQAQFNESGERQKEIERRAKSGESTSFGELSRWESKQIEEIIAGKKPATPDLSPMEIWGAAKDAFVNDPKSFGAKIARGLVTHPEMFLPGAGMPALPARMAAIAKMGWKIGTEIPQIAAVAAVESGLQQKVETGVVKPGQTVADVGMMVAPVMALRMVADLAVARNAKVRNIDPSPELVKTAVTEAEAKVKAGTPLDQALKESLESIKIDPEVAAEAAAMLKPHVPDEVPPVAEILPKLEEPQIKAERIARGMDEIGWAEYGGRLLRKQPEGAERGLVGEGEVIGRTKWIEKSDLWPTRPDKSLSEKAARTALDKYAADEKLTPREERFVDHVDRTLLERDKPYLDADRESAAEREAIQWESALYRNVQSGAVDQRLLRALGIASTAGALGYLYNHDPKDAITAALATGGVLAAGALIKRGASAVAESIKDNRYLITDITDRYSADNASAQLANMRLAEQVKALVSNKTQREQLTHYLQGDRSVQLTPEMAKAAEAVEHYFDAYGKKGQSAGILPDELLDNYVTQLWTGLNKNDPLLRNLMNSMGLKNLESHPGMAQRTRFGLERTIPSYKEGMAKGMIPTTLDIADIMRVYGDNIARVIANKNLFKTLENTRTPWGEKLMVRDTPDGAAKQISQAAAIIDKQLEGEGAIGQDIRNFAISKAPRNYVPIDHPQMRGYKVHEDIAPVMKNLFDAQPNAVTNLAYAAAVASKRAIFSYSLFHTKTLAEALLGGGYKGVKNVLTGEAWRQLKGGAAGDVVDELVRGGLKVVDRPLEGDVTPFSNALKLISDRHPLVGLPAKGALAVQRGMDWVLWDVVQPTFKTALGMASMEKVLAKNPGMPRTQAARLAASYTNDIFGGLDWFKIADGVQSKMGRDLALAVTSPRGRQFLQIAMLAPDWTVSTVRAMAKAIPGVSEPALRQLHQGYVVRSLLLYAAVADGLNMAFSGHHFWENQDPTMVDLGDGRKLQLSKHIMEPIHWLINPEQQALNKLGWVVKEPIEQMMNKQYLSAKGAPPITSKDASFLTSAGQRVEHAVGSMMPIPGQTLMQYGPSQAGLGFVGLPVYGKSDTQAEDDARAKAREKGKSEEDAAAKEREKRRKKREKQQQGANP